MSINDLPPTEPTPPDFDAVLHAALRKELPAGELRSTEQSLRLLHSRLANLEQESVSGVSLTPKAPQRTYDSAAVAESTQGSALHVQSQLPSRRWSIHHWQSHHWRWASLAAFAVFVVALGLWPTAKQHWPSLQSPAPVREYTTLHGQRTQVRLPDNTLVELNVASRLRVPENFGKTERRVFLDGEARFTVVANNKSPFLVEAGGATIRDLSTVFNVRAYPGSAETQVAVTEGRVTVTAHAIAPNNQAIVNVNQVAVVSADGSTRTSTMDDPTDYVGWTNGVLKFNDVPLGVVLTELSRWYDVQFRLDDAQLAANRVTMTVRGTTFTIANVREFAETIDAHVVQAGNVFVLTRAKR